MITIHTAPISVNRLYRGRKFLTSEGEATKEAIGFEAKAQWKNKKPIAGLVYLEIRFYFKNDRMDIDNGLKALLDCVKGVLWEDDKQIVELHVFKRIDKDNPRIEIEAIPL